MVKFVHDQIGNLAGRRILDIGAGKGGIAAAFAAAGSSVVCVDKDITRCDAAGRLVAQLGLVKLVTIIHALAQTLPFENNAFDLVIMNGVLEWVGMNSASPQEEQRKAITEAARVLMRSGTFYLAIENRLFPAFLIVDPHTHQPFVNLLPRSVARFLTRNSRAGPFSTYIYTIWGLEHLLKGSFGSSQLFYPLPHYHYPYQYGSAAGRESLTNAIRGARHTSNLPLKLKLTLFYASIVTRLRLERFCLPYLVVIARKTEPS